jgi:hypothetical protein
MYIYIYSGCTIRSLEYNNKPIELERMGKNRIEFNMDLYHINANLLCNNLIKNKVKDFDRSIKELKKLLIMFGLKMDEDLCTLVLVELQGKWIKPSGMFMYI